MLRASSSCDLCTRQAPLASSTVPQAHVRKQYWCAWLCVHTPFHLILHWMGVP